MSAWENCVFEVSEGKKKRNIYVYLEMLPLENTSSDYVSTFNIKYLK